MLHFYVCGLRLCIHTCISVILTNSFEFKFIFHGDAFTAFMEVLSVPEQEHIYNPDVFCVVVFPSLIGVEYLHEFFGMEELFCIFGGEGFFYDLIEFVIS